MRLTKRDQIDLVTKIEEELSSLGDYLYGDKDVYVNNTIKSLEMSLKVLKNSFYDDKTYIKLRDRETGEKTYRYFDKGDIGALCYKAAQMYAWSDCDDTYAIEEIMCDGVKLEYVGWQPCMLFEFREVESRKIVYSAEHPEWDH